VKVIRSQLKCDGTRAETRFRLSAIRTGPFKLAGASVQSTTGSRGVRISGSNAGYTVFRGSVKGTVSHSIRQFPLHFSSHASPRAITFQLESTPDSHDSYFCHIIILFLRVCKSVVFVNWTFTSLSHSSIWGLFERAASSLNKLKCQLDATR